MRGFIPKLLEAIMALLLAALLGLLIWVAVTAWFSVRKTSPVDNKVVSTVPIGKTVSGTVIESQTHVWITKTQVNTEHYVVFLAGVISFQTGVDAFLVTMSNGDQYLRISETSYGVYR